MKTLLNIITCLVIITCIACNTETEKPVVKNLDKWGRNIEKRQEKYYDLATNLLVGGISNEVLLLGDSRRLGSCILEKETNYLETNYSRGKNYSDILTVDLVSDWTEACLTELDLNRFIR